MPSKQGNLNQGGLSRTSTALIAKCAIIAPWAAEPGFKIHFCKASAACALFKLL
jgi:hypothetical protein